jgi:hypothetical protein
MQHDAPELRGPHDPIGGELADSLARIEAALARAETASAALQARHHALQSAARDTVAGLDRLLAADPDSRTAGLHG